MEKLKNFGGQMFNNLYEISKTISIGNSLSYEKCTDEHIKALKKAFKKNGIISLNVSGSTFLNTTSFNNSLHVSGRTIL
jgi:hypothetical protein